MIEQSTRIAFATIVTVAVSTITAQAQSAQKCRGPIYSSKDVTRRAKIISRPDLNLVNSVAQGAEAHVSIEAVLCRSGRVTDIQLINGVKSEISEFLKRAVARVTFTPAELNWHTVSQEIQFDFDINGWGLTNQEISPADAKGRLVEAVEMVGTRRFSSGQIFSWIKTRPGEPFDCDQIQRDFAAILAKGYFDKRQTRVTMTDGVRGGVDIVFEIVELPLIAEIDFKGLKQSDELAVRDALSKSQGGIQKGQPLDDARARAATGTIKQFFESRGWRDVRVEFTMESLSATEIAITFAISGYKFQ